MAHFTPAQNERLRRAMLAYRREECRDSTTTLARRLGREQPSLSNFLNRKGGAAFQTAQAFADLVGRDVSEIIGPAELQEGEDLALASSTPIVSGINGRADPPVGTFLMKLRRLPGLEQWIEEHPTALKVSELAVGMAIYDTVKPASQEDGQPINGWDAFFDDALSGRLTRTLKGDVKAAEALERGQLPRSTRRKLHPATKNR